MTPVAAAWRGITAVDDLVAGYAPELRSWYGDQMAIAALLGNPEFPEGTSDVMDSEAGAVRYRLLPAADWNYSAPLDAHDAPQFAPAPDAGIVHFKGERKEFMLRYASEVLGLEIAEDAASPGGWRVTDPKLS